MKTVFSPLHSRRHVKTELDGGLLIEPHEKPSRAETILARVKDQALGEILEPEEFGLEPVKRVHTAEYVAFLETAIVNGVACCCENILFSGCALVLFYSASHINMVLWFMYIF